MGFTLNDSVKEMPSLSKAKIWPIICNNLLSTSGTFCLMMSISTLFIDLDAVSYAY